MPRSFSRLLQLPPLFPFVWISCGLLSPAIVGSGRSHASKIIRERRTEQPGRCGRPEGLALAAPVAGSSVAGWLSLAGSGAAREVSGVEDAVAGSSPLMVMMAGSLAELSAASGKVAGAQSVSVAGNCSTGVVVRCRWYGPPIGGAASATRGYARLAGSRDRLHDLDVAVSHRHLDWCRDQRGTPDRSRHHRRRRQVAGLRGATMTDEVGQNRRRCPRLVELNLLTGRCDACADVGLRLLHTDL